MEHNKKRLGKSLLPIFIIVLMVFSTFGIIIGGTSRSQTDPQKIEYKEYEFKLDSNNKWYTYKDGQKLEFLYDPLTLENVYTGDLFNKIFSHKKTYLSVNPNEAPAREIEFFRSVSSSITNKPFILSCFSDFKGCETLPLKDCNDSIINEVLVINLVSGQEAFQEEGSCIGIVGNAETFIKVAEKIRLEYLTNG